jgi:hypothetical protein
VGKAEHVTAACTRGRTSAVLECQEPARPDLRPKSHATIDCDELYETSASSTDKVVKVGIMSRQHQHPAAQASYFIRFDLLPTLFIMSQYIRDRSFISNRKGVEDHLCEPVPYATGCSPEEISKALPDSRKGAIVGAEQKPAGHGADTVHAFEKWLRKKATIVTIEDPPVVERILFTHSRNGYERRRPS